MCAIYFINKQCIESVGDLRKIIDPSDCLDSEYSNMPIELSDTQCLCSIDPIKVALRLDKLVLVDPCQSTYSFQDRD